MRSSVIIRIVNNLLRPIKNKLMLIVGRGILLAVNSNDDIQKVQLSLLADEVKDKVELFQHFGFTSVPPKDTECVMVSVSGNRDNGIVVATENRELRIKGLKPGEACLYSKNGKYIKILDDDNIEVLLSKLKIENDEYEFVDVLSEWMQGVIDSETLTALGPQKLTPDTILALTEIKEKLDTFKVS